MVSNSVAAPSMPTSCSANSPTRAAASAPATAWPSGEAGYEGAASVDETGNEVTAGSSARRCGFIPARSAASVVVLVRVSDMVLPCVVSAPADARHGEQVNADAGDTESLDPATSIWPETATAGASARSDEQSDELVAQRPGRRRGAGGHADLRADVGDVAMHGVCREHEMRGDLGVGLAPGD